MGVSPGQLRPGANRAVEAEEGAFLAERRSQQGSGSGTEQTLLFGGEVFSLCQ
jgi:hypothetical protein